MRHTLKKTRPGTRIQFANSAYWPDRRGDLAGKLGRDPRSFRPRFRLRAYRDDYCGSRAAAPGTAWKLSRPSAALSGESEGSETCWYCRRRDGLDRAITYMTERGQITRIDIGPSSEGDVTIISTSAGIGTVAL